MLVSVVSPLTYFYPRPPRGGRPLRKGLGVQYQRISIHALREEGDGELSQVCGLDHDFYPRPPRGGRLKSRQSLIDYQDFYPRPPRGGRRPCHRWRFRGSPISIHALREEGDCPTCFKFYHFMDFYPRPPRRGRPVSLLQSAYQADFYPRPPRGGRRNALLRMPMPNDFYPRPPRGGRPGFG